MYTLKKHKRIYKVVFIFIVHFILFCRTVSLTWTNSKWLRFQKIPIILQQVSSYVIIKMKLRRYKWFSFFFLLVLELFGWWFCFWTLHVWCFYYFYVSVKSYQWRLVYYNSVGIKYLVMPFRECIKFWFNMCLLYSWVHLISPPNRSTENRKRYFLFLFSYFPISWIYVRPY